MGKISNDKISSKHIIKKRNRKYKMHNSENVSTKKYRNYRMWKLNNVYKTTRKREHETSCVIEKYCFIVTINNSLNCK